MWWYFRKVKWFVFFVRKKWGKQFKVGIQDGCQNPIWPPKWLTIPTPGFLSRTPQKPLQTRDRNSIEGESIMEKNLQWKGLFLHSLPSVEHSWPQIQNTSNTEISKWTVLWPIYSRLQPLEAEIRTVLQIVTFNLPIFLSNKNLFPIREIFFFTAALLNFGFIFSQCTCIFLWTFC